MASNYWRDFNYIPLAVDGDGLMDILRPLSWFHQVNAISDRLGWRPEWECHPARAAIGIPVFRRALGGPPEIVSGSGHDYGVYSLKSGKLRGEYIQTTLESYPSKAHSLILADADRSGRPQFVTGERYRAHDHDPGLDDPMEFVSTGTGHWAGSASPSRTGRERATVYKWLRLTGARPVASVSSPQAKSGLYLFENHRR